ncbi:MAG: cytochrome d ubiquinol oxidase subunit II [Terriglobia bacterium]
MQMLWFGLAAVMVAVYVILDGFDFGAGALHLWVARSDPERRQVLGAIGPFWDGNEVWLLAGGGVLFLAFPKVLASGLSGFYLAIMLLLWTLILRGISIEFRSHIEDNLWRTFWDAIFGVSSTVAPVLLGAALGNLIRGVPLRDDGWFELSLFDSFSPRGRLGILDWYTILAGVLALAALLHHGALFLVWKTDGPVRARSLNAAERLFPVLVLCWVVVTAATVSLVPELFSTLAARPLAWLATLLFLAGLITSFLARRAGKELLAFLGSSAFLLGVLGATAVSVYPSMIRSIDHPERTLTALNAAAGSLSLRVGLYWWPLGFVLAVVYLVILFRLHRDKVRPVDGEGY